MAIVVNYDKNNNYTGVQNISGNNNFWITFNSTDTNSEKRAKIIITDVTSGSELIAEVIIDANADGVFDLNTVSYVKYVFDKSEDLYSYNTLVYTIPDMRFKIALKFDISIQSGGNTETFTETYTFVNTVIQRNEDINIPIGVANVVTPIKSFKGYPLEYGLIDNSNNYTRNLYSTSVADSNVIQLDKGQGKYLKWQNQQGGYSYWLFDCVYQESLRTKSIGKYRESFNNTNSLLELGKTATKRTFLNTSLELKEIPLIESLALSSKVYLYDGDYDLTTPSANSNVSFKPVILKDFNDEITNNKTSAGKEFKIEIEETIETITVI